MEQRQQKTKEKYDEKTKLRNFEIHQPVRVRNYRRGQDKGTSGIVEVKNAPATYIVKMSNNNHRRLVHVDQMIADKWRSLEDSVIEIPGEQPVVKFPDDQPVVTEPRSIIPEDQRGDNL